MAPKNEVFKSKKRKRVSNERTEKTQSTKNPDEEKQQLTKPTGLKPKPFSKKPVHPAKNGRDSSKKEGQLPKKDESRKKWRKRLEQELAVLWEKMRRRNIAKEERSKFVSEALQKMKGKIPEIAVSHVSSRILQTCVKYCSDPERDAVYTELRPCLPTLCINTYAVHLVVKMFSTASKAQLPGLISLLRGRVARLLKHTVGSVVEAAYTVGNATQKRELLLELYSKELQLFKDLANMKETRVVEIISKLGLKKLSVSRHMNSVLQPLWEKGIVDHTIIHKALLEYLSIADKMSAKDIVKTLSGSLLVRIVHTKDGSRIGMLCVKHGSAKERKLLLKEIKGEIGKMALNPCGNLVLVSILSTVDDTKLVSQIVIRELQTMLKELALDKNGRRPLLQLLHPFCQRYFSPDDLACLNSSIPSLCTKAEEEADQREDKPVECPDGDEDESNIEEANHDTELPTVDPEEDTGPEDTHVAGVSKKDPFVRRQELLVKSGLAESLVDVCIESAEELLKSNFGKEVLYEVATGGADGILHPTLDKKLTSLYEKIAALAAEPKSDESEHIFDNFHSSRTIRKLVLDCPTFASTLWEAALKGKCKVLAEGHSSRIVAAFSESSDLSVRKLTKKGAATSDRWWCS